MDAAKIEPLMEPYLQFFVPGTPAPGGSKRGFYVKKLNRVVMAPDSQKTRPWMAQVSDAALMAMRACARPVITAQAILLWVEFRMPRPKAHYGTGSRAGVLKRTAPDLSMKKPDLTKLVRAVEDALTGIVWTDDSQVALQNTAKRYCVLGLPTGVCVKVFVLENT